MTSTYPPGTTYFDTVKRSFAAVSVKDGYVPTLEFLEAAQSLTGLFDVLGGVAFKPVKTDMEGNIKKIRTRYDEAPSESQSLQDLARNELKNTKKHTASEGLLWLTRGLDFTSQALRRNLNNPSEELSTSFREAYGNTLKQHHSFVVKPIFSAAMSATPYRKDFYQKLGSDDLKVKAELEKDLKAMEEQVAILKTFVSTLKW
ncbi:glycolipid transfer protein [Piedraia hortae CBS 480.64]|uniref:Glycolipid transfer protein n=1 Tax=Piedraia hortae CBS 480.64 TaxID=1314780 RepID=A0A6A7C0D2_9PEZI|nr:glycolipid transfer protein [Piedraia hortae CBS 480.64]